MMTKSTIADVNFSPLKGKAVEVKFSGGDISSEGGVLLLRKIDQQIGLLEAVDTILPDTRDTRYIRHSQLSLLRQRIQGLCLGYEDLNDHSELALDKALQIAVNKEERLSSPSTLCRFENQADKDTAMKIHDVLIDQFIHSFDVPPTERVLDFDATDDLVHGEQEERFFNSYYNNQCFLPLYVFCEQQLLVSYLRSSGKDGARHAWAILALLVKRFREAWPKVKIIFRGDSGFCRWRMLRWCDSHNVDYIVGIGKNSVLLKKIHDDKEQAKEEAEAMGETVRYFTSFQYAAKRWDKPRRVIAKIEHTEKGSNPRFVVTSMQGDSQWLYDDVYCARGDMENRIKEQQYDLFADRTSCHDGWPNQFRLLLSSLAYVLVESLRRMALKGTALARAQVGTIRLKLFKIGAVILCNTRRIRFLLPTHYPWKKLFIHVAARLTPE